MRGREIWKENEIKREKERERMDLRGLLSG